MIDSHAHLYFDRFDDDREAVIERAREAGVSEIINVGIDLATSEQAIALARARRGFRAAAGIHPTSPVSSLAGEVERLHALAGGNRSLVVAIGEIGLDYHWQDVPPEEQKPKLAAQLELARALELPVIFHCRDALPDLFRLLEAEARLPRGVFHCFAGDEADARRALGLGFHISFAGNVTYPRAEALRNAARVVPAERLLLETDAPFLAPEPRRGRRNEPSFLPFTARLLAETRGLPLEDLVAQATKATRELFALAEPAD